jgi:hypothetical protein
MTVRPTISVGHALQHKHLFGPFFSGDSWDTWRSVLKAAFAEKLSPSELQTFRSVADRDPPAHRVKELACVVGRGGGKDSTASAIAAYIAMSFDPKAAKLRPGELAYVLCLAVDRDQAGIVWRYIKAFFEEVPTLKAMVRPKGIGTDNIELKNRVVIQVVTNSYRSVRGRSILAAVFDEVSFWRDERAANPDSEVHAAITPGLARVPGSMLILISSAHRRAGLLYDRWKSFFGKASDDVLVVRGTTTQFNPTFDQGVIEKALALDPQRYGAEYNSNWRDDLATFVSRDLLDAAVERGVVVRPPILDGTYSAFCDPSGGMADAFTACIAHKEENGRVIIDCLYERRPPFNPSEVIEDIGRLLKTYRLSEVTGDRYAAQFVVEAYRKCGIQYVRSRLDRSEIYLGFLPLIAAGRVLLIDHPRAISQFAGLERRSFPSGKDKVDHPLNGHDDLSNAIAGAGVLAAHRVQEVLIVTPFVFGTPRSIPGNSPAAASQAAVGDNHSTTQKFYDYYSGGNSSSDWWGPV